MDALQAKEAVCFRPLPDARGSEGVGVRMLVTCLFCA